MPKLLLFSICEDILPPLGILYIASYLREYLGWQDISVETAATDQLQRIKQHRPDIVGFTSVTRDWKKVSAVAKQVKEELAIPCFVGGHHISAIPHTLPSWFDFAVIGEGEE
ncbi:MAG: cobalamin-dependent protein, partial [Dehalococcoidia bacterium]|nr:cobalamin-dependent protein [Dehalococcoidia bacterium]